VYGSLEGWEAGRLEAWGPQGANQTRSPFVLLKDSCGLDHRPWISAMRIAAVALFLLLMSPVVGLAEDATVPGRDPAASIVRFGRVDARLYRGGQPGPEDFAALRDLGVRTVVSLRDDNGAERQRVESLGMSFVHVPVTLRPFGLSGTIPREAIMRFFQVVDDPASGIVFVHCRHGKDRTGFFVSLYRIARQRWTVEDAYREARQVGMAWWHFLTKGQMESLAPDLLASAPPGAPVAPAPAYLQLP
jgi:protein tyrosine phosphatase (PTP) superfamily phosphohydrolase (DUF442 family)